MPDPIHPRPAHLDSRIKWDCCLPGFNNIFLLALDIPRQNFPGSQLQVIRRRQPGDAALYLGHTGPFHPGYTAGNKKSRPRRCETIVVKRHPAAYFRNMIKRTSRDLDQFHQGRQAG